MGKKVKKKARNVQKEKRVSTPSRTTGAKQNIPSTETVDDGVLVIKERKLCPHLEKGIDLDKVSSKVASLERVRCEDCREGAVDRRAGKGRGKQGKKKGGGSADIKSDSKAIWICLECGHLSCGGIGFPTTPQSHAGRHARQTRHPLAMQFENLQLRWCFPCNTLISVENSEASGEQKDALSNVVKLIKGRSTKEASVDGEDVWLGSGSVLSDINSENIGSCSLDGRCGYVARGLVNLGNTCFFNSVMQNLLAINRLRDHFMELDETVGPLTVSLKKLYIETSAEAGLRNVINPRSFFGCVCATAPQFRGYQQHDSHELLRCLLDGLCTEELRGRKKAAQENDISASLGPTFVDFIFGGQLSSTVSCLECGHSSTVFEPFLDLSLPVPTKKQPSKRGQAISRAKKQKLPPKRSGRVHPKVNRVARSAASEGVSNTVADKKSFVSSNRLTAHGASLEHSTSSNHEEQDPVSNEHTASGAIDVADIHDSGTRDSVDDLIWLDFLSDDLTVPSEVSNEPVIPNEHNTALRANDIADTHDSGSRDSVDNSTWLGVLSDDFDMPSEVNNESVIPRISSETELPLQVQNSEVLLLPYKDETSAGGEISRDEAEVSLSAVNYEPDPVVFDGLGDLFNEPEIAAGPIMKPSSSDNNFQADEIVSSGFSVGNNSESDPDEVDNSDSPVSVESCLAYFIKPELLTEEHAWHCENCSKTLQKQRMKLRKKQQKTASKIQIFGAEDMVQSTSSSPREDCPCPSVVKNLSNGDIVKDVGSTFDCLPDNEKIDVYQNCNDKNSEGLIIADPQAGEGNGEMTYRLAEISQPSSDYRTCSQASVSGEASDSCSVNEPSRTGCDTDETQQRKLELLPGGSESEGSDSEEVRSESVKVKRDATKRILINRVPPILTIHLKRFSQDARGRLSKLNGHVDFRDIIDLRPYMDPRCLESDDFKYRLVGVVEHMGSMRGGHYVAYMRGARGNTNPEKENGEVVWYHASDGYVREASLEEVLRCEAYILFYEKI